MAQMGEMKMVLRSQYVAEKNAAGDLIVSQQCAVLAYAGDMPRAWAVVSYKMVQPYVLDLWIGPVPLREAFTFGEAITNSEWRRIVTAESVIWAEVLSIGTRTECTHEASRILINRPGGMPHCNLRGSSSTRSHQMIKCSNGQTYASQIDAARSLNLDQAAISKHLRGKLRNVKGFVFAYIDTPTHNGPTEPPIRSMPAPVPAVDAKGEY